MARMLPRAFISAIVSSFSKEMQSQSRFPPGDCRSKAPLAYRKFRFSADAEKLRRFILEAIAMIRREPLERRPFLAGMTDELPFIFAN
jgi:hypothetical protein